MRLMLSKKLIQIVRTCASYFSTCQAHNAAWHACMQHSISSLLCPPVQSAAYITSLALLLLCAYTMYSLAIFCLRGMPPTCHATDYFQHIAAAWRLFVRRCFTAQRDEKS